MNDYILITQLNDYIFCPYSIYLKNLFGTHSSMAFSGIKQVDGKNIHSTIDNGKYSTSKHIIQAIDVFSNKYNLYGKIDIFNISTKTLIERKKKVLKIFDGYIFQLYAQYYCLVEMGYEIENLSIYSFDDNKKYEVNPPNIDLKMKNRFFKLLKDMQNFNPEHFVQENIKKCQNCIYSSLCTVKQECLDD